MQGDIVPQYPSEEYPSSIQPGRQEMSTKTTFTNGLKKFLGALAATFALVGLMVGVGSATASADYPAPGEVTSGIAEAHGGGTSGIADRAIVSTRQGENRVSDINVVTGGVRVDISLKAEPPVKAEGWNPGDICTSAIGVGLNAPGGCSS